MRSLILALVLIVTCLASVASAGNCCNPVAPTPAYYLVPVAPRGAVLAARRAGYPQPLVFRWLPGDAFRGRGVIVVPK